MRRLWGRIWGWIKGSGRHLATHPIALVIVLVAGVLGALAGMPAGEAGFHYVWRDPNMCDDCHVHDYANEAFFRSVHAELTTCHDCHRVPIMHYPRNLVMTPSMIGTEELENRPHVESVICGACHMSEGHGELTGPMTPELLLRVVKVDESPLHKLHLQSEVRDPGPGRGSVHHTDMEGDTDAAEHGDSEHGDSEHGTDSDAGHAVNDSPINCMDCHGGPMNRAHHFQAGRENCLQCHEGISESAGRLTSLQCQECHFEGFLGKLPEGGSASHE